METNRMTTWVFAAAFLLPAALAWSDVPVVDKVEDKVEGKLNEVKANVNKKEIQKDNVKISDAAQREEYWRDVSNDALAEYNKAVKAYGPASDLTRDAKSRYDKALKECRIAGEDRYSAKGDLHKDQRELGEAREGMKK